MALFVKWMIIISCGSGIIASLVVAFCPCWVLVRFQTKPRKIILKVLCLIAIFGWIAFFQEISNRLGTGGIGMMVGVSVTFSLISLAAIRGEMLATAQGKFEEYRGVFRYTVKKSTSDSIE